MNPEPVTPSFVWRRSGLPDHLQEDPVMERRTFLSGTGAVLLSTPLTAEAQQGAKKYRIGIVLQGGPYYTIIAGLRDGLKELGFEETAKALSLTIPQSLLRRADEIIQ